MRFRRGQTLRREQDVLGRRLAERSFGLLAYLPVELRLRGCLRNLEGSFRPARPL
jgi:hypothetical protein